MLSRGRRVGKYVVEGLLGQGGMAIVYRVRHLELGSEYALKLLTTPRHDIRERLVQEGRFQASVRHPNVVSVLDILQVDDAPALLMEYVDGPTLDRWMRLFQPTFAEAESIFRGVVEGVAEAHAKGVVHRDLKPANVLLSRTSMGFVPKVGDFGIAKVARETEADLSGTLPNVAMGTPHYMAPEQIRDARSVDARADIFSLGCVLFELVSGGEHSFAGKDVLTVLNAVVDGKRLDPREFVPTLDDRVCRVIDGCLEVDREKRFQSCEEILEVLGEVRGHAAVRRGLESSSDDWLEPHMAKERARWNHGGEEVTQPPVRDARSLEEDTQPRSGVDDGEITRPHKILAVREEVGTPGVRRRRTGPPAVAVDSDASTQPPVARRSSFPHGAESPKAVSPLRVIGAVGAGVIAGLITVYALLSSLGFLPPR